MITQMFRDFWDAMRYKPAPERPEYYWNAPEYSEEEQKSMCCVCINEEGAAFGYNPAKQANPVYKGNNKSRYGAVYNPYYHPLGKFFQGTIKGSMLKCVDFVHSGLLKYDASAYEFEDPRLIAIRNEATAAINELFFDELERRTRDDGTRKVQFMLKVLDIGLFLMKEDWFYRWRFIRLLQRIGKVVEQMEPTKEEISNLKISRR